MKNQFLYKTALVDALAEEEDVLERISGITSEQKTNAAALRAEEQALFEQRSEGVEAARQYMIAVENPWYAEIGAELSAATDEYFEHLDSMREYLKHNNADMTAEQIENHEEMIRLEQAYQKKLSTITQKEADIRKNGQIQAAQATANALGQIAGFLQQQGEEGVAAAKAFAWQKLQSTRLWQYQQQLQEQQQQQHQHHHPQHHSCKWPILQQWLVQLWLQLHRQRKSLVVSWTRWRQCYGWSQRTISTIYFTCHNNTTELVNADAATLAPVQAFVVESQLSGSQENIQQIQIQATFGLTDNNGKAKKNTIVYLT
jgi:hypothetical protein